VLLTEKSQAYYGHGGILPPCSLERLEQIVENVGDAAAGGEEDVGDAAHLASLPPGVCASLGRSVYAALRLPPPHVNDAFAFPCTLPRHACVDAVRAGFRDGDDGVAGVLRGIEWIAGVAEGARRTAVAISHVPGGRGEVRVITTSSYFGRRPPCSPTAHAKFMFMYRIRVDNLSAADVQVLGRTWNIANGDGGTQEVDAPDTGVVGHLPVIAPGRSFEYMSGAEITTPAGHMAGILHMAAVDGGRPSSFVGDEVEALGWESDDGRLFHAQVGPFPLTAGDGKT